MGFLDNSSITIDAVLTKYGKQKLANGEPLGITYFGASDTGIDYGLWNEGNTAGSDQYGQAIEDLPMLESPVVGRFAMRYVLGTGIDNKLANEYLILDALEYTLKYSSTSKGIETIIPQTGNFNGNEKYFFEVSDNSGFNFSPGGEAIDKKKLEAPLPELEREEAMLIGPTSQLEIWPIQLRKTILTSITITGATSGASETIRVTALGGDLQNPSSPL
tara:strand:+ start:370 stop:1023 length:654 start_codon:yes stop_codon:yes gene_type:complete